MVTPRIQALAAARERNPDPVEAYEAALHDPVESDWDLYDAADEATIEAMLAQDRIRDADAALKAALESALEAAEALAYDAAF